MIDYFARLSTAFGSGWTRFWFTPSDSSLISAMRLLVGLLVVYLHATLTLDLTPFFGSDGLLNVDQIVPLEGNRLSYLAYISHPSALLAVHLAGLAVLLAFAAGLWTRLTAILALVVFLADINRGAMITSRTENVAAMLMCYLWLAPCGRRFSLDHMLATRRRSAATDEGLSTMATIATRLIQIHLALLVAMSALAQLSGEVWWTGTAMWWLIARPESSLFDLSWLYSRPRVIEFWTHVVMLFELSFTVLIWVPLARPLLLAAGVLVWTSLAVVTGETTFAIAIVIASMAFVSPKWFGAQLGASPAAAIQGA